MARDDPVDQASVGWLSLDESNDDPTSFWMYLIAALHRGVADIGTAELAFPQSAQPPPVESVLTTVLNQVVEMRTDLLLVLDDDHLVSTHHVPTGMAFLLDHLPPRMHLVIATRADPSLPLARLRARGEPLESRASDLRFTANEATAFLNEAMGLHLATAAVTALEARNLFIVPLDDIRGWYRYHHLFANVPRSHLVEEQHEIVPELHRRASTCFERNDDAAQLDVLSQVPKA